MGRADPSRRGQLILRSRSNLGPSYVQLVTHGTNKGIGYFLVSRHGGAFGRREIDPGVMPSPVMVKNTSLALQPFLEITAFHGALHGPFRVKGNSFGKLLPNCGKVVVRV